MYRESKREYLRKSAREYYYRDKVATQARARKAYEKARFKINEKARKTRTDKHREIHRIAAANWRERNREKLEAYKITHKALRDGLLLRLNCEVCNSEISEAHHDDYTRPLDIRWLCSFHHGEHHRLERWGKTLELKQKHINEAMG